VAPTAQLRALHIDSVNIVFPNTSGPRA
jgi:hypothetical protein